MPVILDRVLAMARSSLPSASHGQDPARLPLARISTVRSPTRAIDKHLRHHGGKAAPCEMISIRTRLASAAVVHGRTRRRRENVRSLQGPEQIQRHHTVR